MAPAATDGDRPEVRPQDHFPIASLIEYPAEGRIHRREGRDRRPADRMGRLPHHAVPAEEQRARARGAHQRRVDGRRTGADARAHSSQPRATSSGSCRCDCGDQPHEAMRIDRTRGQGCHHLPPQEGRGIGSCKIRVLRAPGTKGLDTVDANVRLELGVDERDYGVGASIIREMGINAQRLMINTRSQARGAEGYGLKIDQIVPIGHRPNEHKPAPPEDQVSSVCTTLGLDKQPTRDEQNTRPGDGPQAGKTSDNDEPERTAYRILWARLNSPCRRSGRWSPGAITSWRGPPRPTKPPAAGRNSTGAT